MPLPALPERPNSFVVPRPPACLQIISAESMVGYSETAKCSQIARVFDDAHKVSEGACAWLERAAARASPKH